MKKQFPLALCASALAVAAPVFADSTQDEIQDMSDPLAVYTQVGGGITNKGLNAKLGQTYDTGDDNTMAMAVLEVKGIMGDTLGWDSKGRNSVDSIRLRNFDVDLTNGRGSQLDMSYDFDSEEGSVSYSFIQALPKMGAFSLYPLAGAGVAFGNNVMGDGGEKVSGYSVPGTFAVLGAYTKLDVTDKIWLNYNPMWLTSLSGSDVYTKTGFAGKGDILTHEFAASYQINPRLNIRYFANWNEHVDFGDGDHRIELNYQI